MFEIQFVLSFINPLKVVEVPVRVPLYFTLSCSVPVAGNKETQFTPFVNPKGKSDSVVAVTQAV